VPISGKATRPSSSMGWRPTHRSTWSSAGWASRDRLCTHRTGFTGPRWAWSGAERTKASTDGLADEMTSSSPVPRTGNSRRTARIRRIQCRNELGLRCWASTFTAANP